MATSSKVDNAALLEFINEKFSIVTQRLDELDKKVNGVTKVIDQDLKLSYLNSVARFLERDVTESVNSMSCSYQPDTEIHCKSWVVSNIKGYLDNLSMGNLAGAYIQLRQFLAQVKRNALDVERNIHCRSEWMHLLETLENHSDFIQEISTLFVPQKFMTNLEDSSFDPEFISSEFIVPLSHPLRIKIIYLLTQSSKRFTSLKDELGIKNTGLLVHHLKPLTDTDFVTQNYKKEYLLTDKGHLVARFLTQIDKSLRPENSISIQNVNIDNINWKKLTVIND